MLSMLHRPFEVVSTRVGASPGELKLLFSFLLSYPLAGILKRIPDSNPQQKNTFIVCVSTFYLIGLLQLYGGLWTLFISAAGAYTIATHLRSSPYMPWVGFAFLMGHMSVSHIWRQFAATDPSELDITGAQMVLVMKLSAFCWNVADGQLPEDQLSEFQKDRKLEALPSLLDYAGYVLFFPALMAGPAFDYVEYRRWIDTTMFNTPAQIDPAKKPPVRKKRKIPRSGTPATWKALSSFVWLGLFMGLGRHFGPERLLSRTYSQHSLVFRIWVMYLASLTARLKYYGVWNLTEGACILAGLGFKTVDPATGKVSWDRLQNIDPWMVETAQNPRAFLGGWNMNTNNWLRNYVYLRVTPRGKKPGFRASMITFFTSALWHGFFPGYYLSFVLASLIQTSAKNFRRHVRPFFLDPITGNPTSKKPYYDWVTYVMTQLTFSFTTIPFLILGFQDSLRVWSNVYFYALIWTVVSMAFFASPAKQSLKQRLETRVGKANAKLVRTLSTDSITGKEPILGISKDLEEDITEAVDELRKEMASRQVREKKKQ